MRLLMGIDLGSTSLKTVLFDENGECVAEGSVPTQVEYLDSENPKWAFWHPDHLWQGVLETIRMAVKQISDAADIKGICVTGFGMDGVPVDKDGKWLYPFISWHCMRTLPQSKKFAEKIGAEEIFKRTGKQIEQIDSIYRMMWVKENYPEILEKTDKWLLVEDFINCKLCGSKTIDYSMAFCTSVFDIRNKKWDEELITHAGINQEIFPEIVPSGTKLGEIFPEVAALTGLKEGTPVFQGGHDYICSALAMGIFTDTRLMDITGTWEIVLSGSELINTGKKVFSQGLSLESHVVRGKCCLIGSAVSSDMVEWFRNNYCFEEVQLADGDEKREWKLLIQRAESAPIGSRGCIFLPHFAGAGAPHRNDESRGAFLGLNNLTEKSCMLRSIFEGLSYQMREMIEAMEAALDTEFKTIVVTGGAVKNDFWMQLKADITGKELVVPDIEASTALGASLIAGIGAGIYSDEQEAFEKTFALRKKFVPRKEATERYDELYTIYKKIYPALISVNQEISRLS